MFSHSTTGMGIFMIVCAILFLRLWLKVYIFLQYLFVFVLFCCVLFCFLFLFLCFLFCFVFCNFTFLLVYFDLLSVVRWGIMSPLLNFAYLLFTMSFSFYNKNTKFQRLFICNLTKFVSIETKP